LIGDVHEEAERVRLFSCKRKLRTD
jgi:hypothetical protein